MYALCGPLALLGRCRDGYVVRICMHSGGTNAILCAWCSRLELECPKGVGLDMPRNESE